MEEISSGLFSKQIGMNQLSSHDQFVRAEGIIHRG